MLVFAQGCEPAPVLAELLGWYLLAGLCVHPQCPLVLVLVEVYCRKPVRMTLGPGVVPSQAAILCLELKHLHGALALRD